MYPLAVTPNGHLEGRGSLPPPLIMRTAATPMPTPKSSPHLDPAPGLLESRRGSSSSVDPQLGDQKSLVGTLSAPAPGFTHRVLGAFPSMSVGAARATVPARGSPSPSGGDRRSVFPYVEPERQLLETERERSTRGSAWRSLPPRQFIFPSEVKDKSR